MLLKQIQFHTDSTESIYSLLRIPRLYERHSERNYGQSRVTRLMRLRATTELNGRRAAIIYFGMNTIHISISMRGAI